VLVGTYLFLVWTGYSPTDAPMFNGDSSLTGSLVASLLYAHDYFFGHLPRLFPPGWSLEVEVQFYVFAPLFFYVYFVRVPQNWKLPVGLVVAAATIVLSGWVGSVGNRNIQLTLLRYFPYFWTGIILSSAANSWERWSLKVPSVVMSAAAWIALPIFVWLNTVSLKSQAMADLAYAGSIIAIAIMFLGALGAGSFRGFCGIPWFSLLGGACYSIYLTHLQISQVITHLMFRIGWFTRVSWPVQLGVAYVVEVPIIFALGLAFYALIERPFMLPNWPKAMWNRIKNPMRTAA
jgi:peptidoglycan/LPS O-acetylase OafA/YrhL